MKKLVSVLTLALIPIAVCAQSNIFNQILNQATKDIKQGRQPDNNQSQRDLPSSFGMPVWRGDTAPLYPTKAIFLDAVRRGDLAGNERFTEEEKRSLVATIAVILADEYQTPIPQDDQRVQCRQRLSATLLDDLRSIKNTYARTLSDRPPEFRNGSPNDQLSVAETVRKVLIEYRHVDDFCSRTVLGRIRPLPMVDSLQDLLEEYATASSAFVEEKRAALIRDFQAKETAKLDAKQRQEADRRNADQRRIDAERQRIEDQQRNQKQINAERVSG